MTAVDQDEAADRFARYIDRVLTPYVPDVSRWDLARRIVQAARDEHWRCLPPAPDVIEQSRSSDAVPANEEFLTRKAEVFGRRDQLNTRKDDRG